MRGAFNHNFDPYWSGAIYGAYAQLQYGNGGAVASLHRYREDLVQSLRGITTCNPNFNIGQIGGIIRWTPVKNLTFSADVTYTMLDQKFEGLITAGSRLRCSGQAGSYLPAEGPGHGELARPGSA